MVIEAKSGFLSTLIESRDFKSTFRGNRIWKPLDAGLFLNISSNIGEQRVEVVIPESLDTIRYEVTTLKMGCESLIKQERATGIEINEPSKPWTGRVRYVNP